MLLSLTLLTLFVVKGHCLLTNYRNMWKGAQVYIYKKELVQGGHKMENGNQ